VRKDGNQVRITAQLNVEVELALQMLITHANQLSGSTHFSCSSCDAPPT
jgi:hypothetical protein